MSGLNGSAGFRPAPVVRSEAEWTSIMADFERSGLSRREFCESREQSLKTFGNGRRRLPAYPRSALSRLERRTDCTFVVPNMIETMKFVKNLTPAQSRLPSKAFKY